MDEWIGNKGNWPNGFGKVFINFRDGMQRYYLRLTGQTHRAIHEQKIVAPLRNTDNSLHVYLKEPRRVDKTNPSHLRPLNKRLDSAIEYEMIDVNDYMEDMSTMQRHRYILQMKQGLSFPIFHYMWTWGVSRAGVNPHVIWLVPPLSDKEARDEGMTTCQRNIEYLKKNTVVYHSRAKRSAYMVVVVNKSFVCSTTVAHAIFEFITGDRMATTCVTQEDALEVARYALNCPDNDIILDMRRLNARPKGDAVDKFWAKMAQLGEGRVSDRRHGDTLYMPIATTIPSLIKITVDALELRHAPKTVYRSRGVTCRVFRGSLFNFAQRIHCPQVPLTIHAI